MAKVGSSGIAKAGLATGITGTALGGIAVLKEAYDTVTKNRNANANSGGAATGATAVPGGVPAGTHHHKQEDIWDSALISA